MRCAIYARYSSENQNEESIESQIAASREFIGREGWTLAEDHIYMDYAVSGATLDRQGLKALIEAAHVKPKSFEKVIVFSISRLSRNGLNEQLITSQFERLGVDIISVSEPLHNITGSGKKAAAGAIRLVNEVLLEQISEHTKRGQDYAASQGFKTTWAPYGYMNKKIQDPNGIIDKRTGQPRLRLIWEINQEKAEVVKQIFNDYLQGNGLKRLAGKLNKKNIPGPRGGSWAPSALREILKNHSYLGWFCLGKHHRTMWPDGKKTYIDKQIDDWRIYKDVHEPIISEEVFNKVQQKMAAATKHHFSSARSDNSRYLLTGLIKCGVCGANFIVQGTRTKAGQPVRYRHYVCGFRSNRGKSVCSNTNRIKMESLDKAVLRGTQQKLLDPVLIDEVINKAEEIIEQARLQAYEIEKLEREKRDLNKQIERLVNYMAMQDIPRDTAREFAKNIKERSIRIKEIETLFQRPAEAKQKVARIMLPFFGRQKVALQFIGAQEKPAKYWHAYLKENLEQLIIGLRESSPAIVREELKKHIRRIIVQADGTIEIQGTSQGIFCMAGLVKEDELGSVEFDVGPETPTIENAQLQECEAYTRKNGVPNRI